MAWVETDHIDHLACYAQGHQPLDHQNTHFPSVESANLFTNSLWIGSEYASYKIIPKEYRAVLIIFIPFLKCAGNLILQFLMVW